MNKTKQPKKQPQSPKKRKPLIIEEINPDNDRNDTEQQMIDANIECRICLEGHVEGNELISPCRCTGSIRYVHYLCIKQWIETNRQKKVEHVRCQLLEPVKQCNSWGRIIHRVRANIRVFFFILFLFLLSLGLTIYLVCLLGKASADTDKPKLIEIGVISFSIFLLLIITAILGGILVREFVYTERKEVVSIANNQNQGLRKRLNTTCSEGAMNRSNAKIYPLTVVEIQ